MSERRKPGEWVILEGGIIAQIQEEDDPEACMRCKDGDCLDWSTLLTRGGAQTFMHVSECQMATLPSLDDLPNPPDEPVQIGPSGQPETFTPFNLLHRLWTKAVGEKGYKKPEWMALERVVAVAEEHEKLIAEMDFLSEALLHGLNMGPALNARAEALLKSIKNRRMIDISNVREP